MILLDLKENQKTWNLLFCYDLYLCALTFFFQNILMYDLHRLCHCECLDRVHVYAHVLN